MPFDIAVDQNGTFRFEYGPNATAYITPTPARETGNPVIHLPDGRIAEQAQLSLFESIFGIETYRLTESGPQRVDDVDPLVGYLAADAETALVQLRLTPELSQPWPPFPPILVASRSPFDAEPVLEAARAAVAELAPPGWAKVTVDCTATMRHMELVATVTFADGRVRSWSPPPMVSQWLHRLRVCSYSSVTGVWSVAHVEFTPGAPPTHWYENPHDKPTWRINQGIKTLEYHFEDLRLLPRAVHQIPLWLFQAAGDRHTRLLSDNIGSMLRGDQQARDSGITEMARLFDGSDAQGRPVWFRPMVGRPEEQAIVDYLRNAPLVLSSRGLSDDLLDGGDEPMVPMGFHTDGRWVWPSATGYYLDKHQVPPVVELVDHIRNNRYQLPDEVPKIAMSRAAALAMGRPWSESEVEDAFENALNVVYDAVTRWGISPRFWSLGFHRDQSWCLARDGDWYVAYWADGDQRENSVRFGDVKRAAAYVAGQLVANNASLQYQEDEEIRWWQSPVTTISDVDPPLQQFKQVMTTTITDAVVDRHGTPDGNMLFLADTPFEQRGLPSEHRDREYHRYRLTEQWKLVTALSEAGGRMYLLPQPIAHYLATGEIEEITAAEPVGSSNHPGLPPITDAMREEGRRNPGGWVWCADRDVDPRYIEGVPNFALLGAYKVDQAGELTGETYINDEYRPGPSKRGFPEPRTEFELVLNFIAAGWLPHERILGAALSSPFILDIDSPDKLRIGVDAQGRRFLAVYSSPRYAPRGGVGTMQADGRGLLPLLTDATLIVNPGGEMSIELPGNDLIAAGRMPR